MHQHGQSSSSVSGCSRLIRTILVVLTLMERQHSYLMETVSLPEIVQTQLMPTQVSEDSSTSVSKSYAFIVDSSSCTSCGVGATSCDSNGLATACSSGLLLTNPTGICTTTCGAGTYKSGTNCNQCGPGALTCLSPTQATSW